MKKVVSEISGAVFSLPWMCNIIPITPEALEGTRVSHRAALAPLLDNWGQPNSDFYPSVDLFAERTRYLGLTAEGFVGLASDRFDITAPFFNRQSGLSREPVVSMPRISRVGARALSATLRALRDGAESPPEGIPIDFRGAIHRWEQWSNSLSADRPPSDWGLWVSRALDMEADIGGGTAGIVDEALYRDIGDFLDRHDAPDAVRDVIAFRHGTATWDFDEVSRAADALLPGVMADDGWIFAEDVLYGGTVAKLRLGDVDGAVELWELLGRRVRRDGFDLRFALLKSYLDLFEANLGS